MSLSIVALNLQNLSNSELKSYRQFLDKSFWTCLKGHDPWGISSAEIFAAAALDENGNPVGLAISTYYRYNAFAQLLSLCASVEFCTEELYKQLFEKIREMLCSEKCAFITHTYSSIAPNAAKMENLFNLAGAGTPQLVMVRCHFDLQAFGPAWLSHYLKNRLPEDLDIIPWKKLSSAEQKKLRDLQQQGSFTASISPFYEERKRDANLSLVARYQGEIIGWIILHRTANDTIRFSTFYVDRDFRNSRVPAWLLAKAIVLAQQAKFSKATFEFNLEQVDRRWIDFVKKRLAPFAQQIERIYQVGLELMKD